VSTVVFLSELVLGHRRPELPAGGRTKSYRKAAVQPEYLALGGYSSRNSAVKEAAQCCEYWVRFGNIAFENGGTVCKPPN